MTKAHPTTPAVSVIVCTRDRCGKLQFCLRSIETAAIAASGVAVELIVVDNASSDETAEFLSSLSFDPIVTLVILREDRKGLSRARNLALDHAKGETLVFIDDDCEMHPDYFKHLFRHLESWQPDTIRGGRVELGMPSDMPVSIKISPTREQLSPKVPPGGFLMGCNMTMPRRVAAKVGHFDVRFGAGTRLMSAEDTDYLIRAHNAGIVVEYVPDMTVIHHHGRSTPADIASINRGYNFGNGALCMKHLRTNPWLIRHLLWTIRGGLRELAGGPLYCPDIKVSHWPVVLMNLLGAWSYVASYVLTPSLPTSGGKTNRQLKPEPSPVRP